jgi:hypothetical protein
MNLEQDPDGVGDSVDQLMVVPVVGIRNLSAFEKRRA